MAFHLFKRLVDGVKPFWIAEHQRVVELHVFQKVIIVGRKLYLLAYLWTEGKRGLGSVYSLIEECVAEICGMYFLELGI